VCSLNLRTIVTNPEQPRVRFVARQKNAESSAFIDAAFQFNASSVVAHTRLDNHQSQPAALFLCGEERFEDSVDLIFGNAAAGVANTHPHVLGSLPCFESENTAAAHCLDGI